MMMAYMLENFLREIVPEGQVPLAVNIRDLVTAWDKHPIGQMNMENVYNSFPSLVPPKSFLWMEHASRINRERGGALAFGVESPPMPDLIDTWHVVSPYDFPTAHEVYFDDKRDLAASSQMVFFCFFRANKRDIELMCCHGLHLDKWGAPLPGLGQGCLITFVRHILTDDLLEYFLMTLSVFRPFLYITALTNCENIKLVPKKTPLSPGLRRKRERQGIATVPFCEMHFQTPTAPDIEANRWEKIDYLAAGSFADYRDGEGLFGKHKGIYFVKGK